MGEVKEQMHREPVPITQTSFLLEVDEGPVTRTEMWNDIVRSKERRINLALPKEVYVTPFRFRGSTNPRLLESDFVSPLEIGI